MNQHTPGPWKPMGRRLIVGQVEGKLVRVCRLEYVTEIEQPDPHDIEIRFMTNEELQANTQLITAAPKLLKALQDLLDVSLSFHRPTDPVGWIAIMEAKKAISIALGESS